MIVQVFCGELEPLAGVLGRDGGNLAGLFAAGLAVHFRGDGQQVHEVRCHVEVQKVLGEQPPVRVATTTPSLVAAMSIRRGVTALTPVRVTVLATSHLTARSDAEMIIIGGNVRNERKD